jgi:hypothetical protein
MTDQNIEDAIREGTREITAALHEIEARLAELLDAIRISPEGTQRETASLGDLVDTISKEIGQITGLEDEG